MYPEPPPLMSEHPFERWRGETEQRLRDAERRLDALNGNIARGAEALQQLTLKVAEFKTSVRTWGAAVGFAAAVIGPAVSAIVVHYITG